MSIRAGAAGTAELILDAAQRRAQTRGFNGFSYADIAAELNVTTASIHYHFSSKAELGATLINRYTAGFLGALAAIDVSGGSARDRLQDYARIYEDVLASNRLCLCGMLAAEYETLPEAMQDKLVEFFKKNEDWVATLLRGGREQGELGFSGDPRKSASALVSALEGAMLVARAYGGVASFRSSTKLLLAGLCGG